MTHEKLWLFTLHLEENAQEIKRAVLARNPQEAASLVGGQYIELADGIVEQVPIEETHKMGLCGTVRFAFELFHRMDSEEEYLAGIFIGNSTHCYNPIGLLTEAGKAVELFLRRHEVLIPDYVYA